MPWWHFLADFGVLPFISHIFIDLQDHRNTILCVCARVVFNLRKICILGCQFLCFAGFRCIVD